MFVFQFEDGSFYKESGSDYITSKKHASYFASYASSSKDGAYWDRYKPDGDLIVQFKTKNINEAKLYKSKQAVRSSNAYSWGGTIHEVEVNISIKK